MALAPIPAAVAAVRSGSPLIVADDEDRENEGDIVFSAQLASKRVVAWTVQISSGFLCAPVTSAIARRLQLPPMVSNNEDPRGTAYTVTVDAASKISTGISASDRATTLRVLSDSDAAPTDLTRPGHILPLIAADGGVLDRAGHTEAAVDLMLLAGLRPVAGIAEVVNGDGDMMRFTELKELGERDGVQVITIADLTDFVRSEGREPLDSQKDARG